ncbi:MAG: PaaI family thioesterase [Pusillimonas sp.]
MDAQSTYQLADDAPDGFSLIERGGPFFQSLGPVYIRTPDPLQRILGVRIDTRHTNMQGNAHGGMLMTMADGALNMNLMMHYSQIGGLVTVSMNTSFLSPARVGDWMEACVDVTRIGRSLCFADCHLLVGQRRVLRASAVFAVRQAGALAAA